MENQTEIPNVIIDYVAASNAKDIAKVVSFFAEDTLVKDEGNTYHGINEVAAWQQKIHEAYDFQMLIKQVANTKDSYIVTTTLSGTFPGKNPIDVEQQFTIDKNKITALTIQ